MEWLKEFLSAYGMTILSTIVTAVAGYLGMEAKKLLKTHLHNSTKKDAAKVCVQAVEQIYKDLHGEEKLEKALEATSSMLACRGIKASDDELRMLIEAAVAEFNDAFHTGSLPADKTDPET